jgi:Co/Zn/Cd efflux system component
MGHLTERVGNPGDNGFRRTVAIVSLLNLAYFGVEFSVALAIRSVSLFADSADFLEDASVNLLILQAFAWSARRRAHVGMALAGILLLPAVAFGWALWSKIQAPIPPAALGLTVTALGALTINMSCALMLGRYRRYRDSHVRAAFLSARNDVFANVAMIGAGLVTAVVPSVWPDIVVGLVLAYLNADAAREVWGAARSEGRAAAGQ